MRTFSPKLLLLLLLVLRHHAESGSIVKFLPGFEGPLPFELETGYIGIGEEEELQSFYYFIKSEKNPKEDPLLLWISGGPGCSSISALLFENGPVALKLEVYNETLPYLVSTTYSWTKMTNVLFLDQPIGVGFSYKRTPNLDKSSDTIEVLRIYEFLQKWLGEHPEFFSNTFYVGGDSYSGKIVPAIVDKISQENYLCCKPPINLQAKYWANDERVREALQIRKGSIGKWIRCNSNIHYDDDIISSIPYHMNNSINGYRSLIYSGDHDMEVPFHATEAWIRSLNYPIIDDWRPWIINNQIAGYTMTYANKMTYATIKGGGHTAEYKPAESFIMFQRWISGQPL
ncbi:putative sinapoylglucose--sinapoylglucose O-sinapoyltransferase [Arabidopsis thaliana]